MPRAPRVTKAEARVTKINEIIALVENHPILDPDDAAKGAWNVRDLGRSLRMSPQTLNRLISEEEALLVLAADGKIALPPRGMDPKWRSQITDQSALVRAPNGQAIEAERRQALAFAEQNRDNATKAEHITIINTFYGAVTARPRDQLDKVKEATGPTGPIANLIFSNVALKDENSRLEKKVDQVDRTLQAVLSIPSIQAALDGRPAAEVASEAVKEAEQPNPPRVRRRNHRRETESRPVV